MPSDACIGLAESAAEFCLEAAGQRCVVHWYGNIFSHVPSTKVREIAAMLKAIHASEDLAAAREKAIRVIEKLRGLRLGRAVEAAVAETLTYYAFPEEHWRRIRTNNPPQRLLREIRPRTRVVGAFPDGQSALNLPAANLRHIAGTAWSTKRYLNIELLKDQQNERCHHRVSQGRAPLSRPKVRKSFVGSECIPAGFSRGEKPSDLPVQ